MASLQMCPPAIKNRSWHRASRVAHKLACADVAFTGCVSELFLTPTNVPSGLSSLTRLRPWPGNSILLVHSPSQRPLQLGTQGQLRDHLAFLFAGHESLTHQPAVFHSTQAVLNFEESRFFGASDRWVGGNGGVGRKPMGVSLGLRMRKG